MMTGPWSMTASAALAVPDGDECHQPDQRSPREEEVGIQDRHAEEAARHVEQREDRIIEQQHAEHAQRFIAHRASPPSAVPPGPHYRHAARRLAYYLRGHAREPAVGGAARRTDQYLVDVVHARIVDQRRGRL